VVPPLPPSRAVAIPPVHYNGEPPMLTYGPFLAASPPLPTGSQPTNVKADGEAEEMEGHIKSQRDDSTPWSVWVINVK